MAILRPTDVRKMKPEELRKRVLELQTELSKERGSISVGAPTASSGRIREIRKSIARIKTINKEAKMKVGR